MLKYINILIRMIRLNIQNQMAYRVSFLFSLLDSVIWLIISLAFFKIIFLNYPKIGSYSFEQMISLIATFEIIKSILFVCFIESLTAISYTVNDGTIEMSLTRPMSSQFLLSFSKFDIGNVGNLFISIGMLVYSIQVQNINIEPSAILVYGVLIIFSSILLYSVWFILVTLSLYTKNASNITEFFLGVFTLGKYPKSIYKGGLKFLVYFIVPTVFAVTTPFEYLYGTLSVINLVMFMAISLCFLLASNLFWKYSLKKYDSVFG